MLNHHLKLQALELELVSPTKRSNPEWVGEVLAEDFEEFGSSGTTYRKSDILGNLDSTVRYELSNFRFQDLAEGVTLVKYQASSANQITHRSSVWVKSSGGWQMLHHQSTVVSSAT